MPPLFTQRKKAIAIAASHWERFREDGCGLAAKLGPGGSFLHESEQCHRVGLPLRQPGRRCQTKKKRVRIFIPKPSEKGTGRIPDWTSVRCATERITLLSGKLSRKGMQYLSHALENGAFSNLTTVELDQSRVNCQGMITFSIALFRRALSHLSHLSMNFCKINDEDITSLSRAVAKGAMESLQTLYLLDNAIGDDGLTAFAAAIKPSPANPRGGLRRLEVVSLRGNDIGDPGLEAFTAACRTGALTQLKTRDLCRNRTGNGGLFSFCALGLKWKKIDSGRPVLGKEITNEELSKALINQNQFTLQDLTRFGICNVHADNFIESDASYFRPDGSGFANLEMLFLTKNNIGDSGFVRFAETLQLFNGAMPQLEKLFVNENTIGDTGLSAFAEACRVGGVLHSVRWLDLRENRIGDKGMNMLAEALSSGILIALQTIAISVGNPGNAAALQGACKSNGIIFL